MGSNALIVIGIGMLLIFSALVAIAQWVFRISRIVKELEKQTTLLEEMKQMMIEVGAAIPKSR
jgi:hypothetical protein